MESILPMQHLPDIILLQISNYEMPLSHLASGIEMLVHPAAILAI